MVGNVKLEAIRNGEKKKTNFKLQMRVVACEQGGSESFFGDFYNADRR